MTAEMTPVLSASLAHVLLSESPRHAWTRSPELNPAYREEVSDAFDLGTVAHALLLEGSSAVTVIDAPDYRTKAAREARDAARAAGQPPILAHRWSEVQAMVSAAREQLAAHEDPTWLSIEGGLAEVSLFCTLDGVAVRGTPDWLSLDHRRIGDYKSTGGSAHPAAVARTLWDKGYAIQAALYRRIVRAVHGVTPEFAFVVQETAPPYALSVVALGPEAAEFADHQVAEALRVWRRCTETKTWPAFPRRVCYAEAPGWVQAQWLERAYYQEAATR